MTSTEAGLTAALILLLCIILAGILLALCVVKYCSSYIEQKKQNEQEEKQKLLEMVAKNKLGEAEGPSEGSETTPSSHQSGELSIVGLRSRRLRKFCAEGKSSNEEIPESNLSSEDVMNVFNVSSGKKAG